MNPFRTKGWGTRLRPGIPLQPWLDRAAGRRGARAGVAAAEFALVAPVLIVLAIATAEAVSYLRTWHRLEQAAASTVSAATRLELMTTASVNGLFEAAKAVAVPFLAWESTSATTRARTVISVVSNPDNTGNVVSWTCSRGDPNLTPLIADRTTLPTGFVVPRGQSVLVVEIINTTPPWRIMSNTLFFGTPGPGQIHVHAIYRPRSAELSARPTGGCPT